MESQILKLVDSVIKGLALQNIAYAIAGGVAANYYRTTPRQTADIDFAIAAGPTTVDLAKEVLQSLGFSAGEVTQAQLQGGPLFAIKNRSTPIQIVVGRLKDHPNDLGVDFLVPEMPWVKDAVARAQTNLREIGLPYTVPILTPEDLIISKLFAYRDKKTRYKDLDDLKELLPAKESLDIDYLLGKMKELNVSIPSELTHLCHYKLLRESKKIAKLRR